MSVLEFKTRLERSGVRKIELQKFQKCPRRVSIPGLRPCKGRTLPAELRKQNFFEILDADTHKKSGLVCTCMYPNLCFHAFCGSVASPCAENTLFVLQLVEGGASITLEALPTYQVELSIKHENPIQGRLETSISNTRSTRE